MRGRSGEREKDGASEREDRIIVSPALPRPAHNGRVIRRRRMEITSGRGRSI